MLTTGVPIKTGQSETPADDSTMRFMNWIAYFAIATPVVALLVLFIWVVW